MENWEGAFGPACRPKSFSLIQEVEINVIILTNLKLKTFGEK